MVYKCFELYLDINKAFILDLKLFVCFNVTKCQVSKSGSVEFTLALAATNIYKIVQAAVLAVFGGVVLAAALPVLGFPETRGKPLLQTVCQVCDEM